MKRVLLWLLGIVLTPEDRDALLGDLREECHRHIRPSRSGWRAGAWYARQLASAIAFGLAGRLRSAVTLRRSSGRRPALDTIAGDVRFAFRALRRTPGFTTVACLTLALGIGATTAIFGAVNPILFEPLPYPHADRIISIAYRSVDGTRGFQTFGTYRELRARSHAFDASAVFRGWRPSLTGRDRPERLEGQRVSAEYFRTLGVTPALGRDFQPSDDQFKGPRVVILSDAIWRRHFDRDPAVVGRDVMLDDDAFTVIGVMPAGFDNILAPSAEIWSPLQYDMSLDQAWGHHLVHIGRLTPGSTVEQARRDLDAIAKNPQAAFERMPWASMKQGLIVTTLQDDVTSGVKPALVAVVGAVLLVLAIACVNVTNLLLARGVRRRGEFAVRVALGAGRVRLIRQLLVESGLLALVGGTMGVGVALLGIRGLVALSPAGLPRVNAIALDGTVLAFAIGVSTIVGLTVGLIPAVQASRADLHARLQQGSRRTAGGHQLARHLLVIVEVALALVLLTGAGLLFRSVDRLLAIDPGFDTARALTMQIQTSGRRFDKTVTDQFFAQALDAVRVVPGVESAALTSQLPLSGDDEEYGAHFEGDDPNAGDNVFRYAVSPGYFETLGLPLRRGRFLDARDAAHAPEAMVLSESLAARKFPGQDPIGRRLRVGASTGPWFTIVGVVGDVTQAKLALAPPDAVYLPTSQSPFIDNTLSLVVRARSGAAPLEAAIAQAIWSVDKDRPIVRVATLDDLLAITAAGRRFALVLFEAFAMVALVLAAIGIYGVLSGSVTERIREIGVRAALGASRRQLMSSVVRRGLALTAIGMVIGVAGAAAASRALATLLVGISRLDPVTYVAVVVVLIGVAAAACWLPAWRASRVDPLIALRME